MNKFKKFISRLLNAWTESYTKRLVSIIVFNAILWIWASYLLAYIGRVEIADSLSEKVVTAILGVVITYGIKSLVENINKYGSNIIKKDNSNKRDI